MGKLFTGLFNNRLKYSIEAHENQVDFWECTTLS